MKRLIGVTLALALAGCETVGHTVGSIRYDFDSGSFHDKAIAVANACSARMRNPALDAIRGKVELFKSPPDGTIPFAILTDKSAATPDEQRAIGLWARAIEQCQGEARTLLDEIPVPPGATQSEVTKLTSYVTDAWVQASRMRVALYGGQTDYADFAGDRLRLAEDALQTAARYAQDTDEEHQTHDLEDVETAMEPFASLL